MKWTNERGSMGAGCLIVGLICIVAILLILGAVDVALEPVEQILNSTGY